MKIKKFFVSAIPKPIRLSILLVLLFIVLLPGFRGFSQDSGQKEGYRFEMIRKLGATPVKDQHRSGTCWSYSAISLLESELLRMNEGVYDLSEMFIVRHAYEQKARRYVRMHGNMNFSGGGAANDVTGAMLKYGIVPEEVYPGLLPGEKKPVHPEMDGVLKGYVDEVIKNENKKLSKVWFAGFSCLLDSYLGKIPDSFVYDDQQWTPRTFEKSLGLDLEDYVLLGSYTHHPFYTSFILEVPDNWSWGEIYNVRLDELVRIIDHALENNYTVFWGADVSETGFSWKNGVAIVPACKTDRGKKAGDIFDGPVEEKIITQEIRQEAFDNYSTTDDHGMHIVGQARDQEGNEYYYVKNSWGTDGNHYQGYIYVSRAYVRYKTLSIMLHVDAIPGGIRKKLGI